MMWAKYFGRTENVMVNYAAWERVHSKVNLNEVGRVEESHQEEEHGLLSTGAV